MQCLRSWGPATCLPSTMYVDAVVRTKWLIYHLPINYEHALILCSLYSYDKNGKYQDFQKSLNTSIFFLYYSELSKNQYNCNKLHKIVQ